MFFTHQKVKVYFYDMEKIYSFFKKYKGEIIVGSIVFITLLLREIFKKK